MTGAATANIRVTRVGTSVTAELDPGSGYATIGGNQTVPADAVPNGWRIMDAGPKSVAAYTAALAGCKTIIWNGPLGVAEVPQFAKGSEAIAHTLAGHSATSIVGGGESAALVRENSLADQFDHVSTGGGAFLEFLEGNELPGVAALLDA